MYLIDTNVISAAAPSRPIPQALIDWMDSHSAALFLSAVTIAKIVDGIAKSRREGATRKSADLTAWLDTVLHLYGDRIFAFDAATARIAGAMADRARGKGLAPGFADIILAATAQHHELMILSRNLRHLEPLGVGVLNPFVKLPPT